MNTKEECTMAEKKGEAEALPCGCRKISPERWIEILNGTGEPLRVDEGPGSMDQTMSLGEAWLLDDEFSEYFVLDGPYWTSKWIPVDRSEVFKDLDKSLVRSKK